MSPATQTWPAKLAIAALVLTIFPWQYGIYMAGKFLVCVIAVYYLAKKVGEHDDSIKWPLIVIAILYNPLIPIYLYARGLWIIADIITIAIFWRMLSRIN